VRTALARLLNVHSDERAWRLGAKGERLVGTALAKLPSDWFVLHDLPLGTSGANLDHLVVGPGGVFTLNSKYLTGNVWVGEYALLHNGHKTDFLPKARREAMRVGQLLSRASPGGVIVRPVIVVMCDEYMVRAQPRNVAVVRRRELCRWLQQLPATLYPDEAERIRVLALDSRTWSRRL
jgi:hypothetical protein